MSALSIPVSTLPLSSKVHVFGRTCVVQPNARVSNNFCTDISAVGCISDFPLK